ncbi:MAG: hypothetical protein N4A62_17515 [Marinisporobacter sp.]|jgi:hypothetical protein|nr:hypothetical protein [Marinisporobacter sp.]
MNLFRHKSIPSQENHEEKKMIRRLIIFGLAIFFIILLFVFFVQKDVIRDNRILKSVLNREQKKEIFTYLKKVQPLEDRFYTLVSEKTDLKHKRVNQNNKELFTKDIKVIDEMMLRWASIESNDYMIENHYLFLEEMKTMRDILLEKKLSIEYNDEKSTTRGNEYLEKYFIIGKIRRKSLKKVFDKYDIIYLELDNRIKYIPK